MSLERAVFAPVEHLADVLYPYRWRFVFFALFICAIPFALAFAGQKLWPEQAVQVVMYAAPVVMTLIAWAWGANLVAVWFGPPRLKPRIMPHVLPRVRDAASLLARLWGLVVLLAFILSPLFMWYLVLGR